MSPRRALAVSVLASLVTFAACTFPDVSFAPPGEADGGGSGDDGSTDAAADRGTDGMATPGDVDPDGVKQDAATRDGSVVRPEAGADGAVVGCGSDGGNPCDCDGDKVSNNSCAPPKPDCDDFDRLVYPGQGFVAAKWDPTSPHTPAGDWDCDGNVTKQYSYNVSCGLLGQCNGQGFSGDPGCGEPGTYIFCTPGLGIACIEDQSKRETRTQGCR